MIITCISKPLDNLCNSGSFLSNSYINTVQFLLFIGSFIESLLVDDCINGNGSFTVINRPPDKNT